MAVYLVDMENIPHAWGKLLDTSGEKDRFILFYTEQVTQVPMALMVKALESRSSMEYIKCHIGPNGLDFQLVSEMGYRIARDPEAEYIIVSQDHGYDVVIDYWGERGVQTKRVVPAAAGQGVFAEYTSEKDGNTQISEFGNEEDLRGFLNWKLSNRVPKGEIAFIAKTILKALNQGTGYTIDRRLSARFTFLDRALRDRYGNTRGPKIRDQIKAVSRDIFSLDLKPLDQSEEEERVETAAEPVATGTESLTVEMVVVEPEPAAAEADTVKSEAALAEPTATDPKSAAAEADTAEPESAATEPESTEGISGTSVFTRLAALGLPAGRAEEISAIVSEALRTGEAHPRAAVYRRMLSSFGRVTGGELYRAVKVPVGQILSEWEAGIQ